MIKNEEAIDVFIKVVQHRPQSQALIVGGGTLYEVYKQKVVEAGVANNFTFTGFISYADLPDYYRKMSMFVAPVHKESFGQVTPFAMNIGIPVVGYQVGALEEIIQDNTLLAAPGDSDQLAKIIVELLDDLPRMQRISEHNHRRAQQYFSVEAMITHYKRIYAQVLLGEKVA